MKILCSKMVATSIEMAKFTQILSSEPIWKWVQAQKFVNIDSVAFGSAAMKYSSFPMPLPPTEDDISFIQYTSGSTGTPKGVINKYCHLMESFKQMNVACGAPLLHLTGRRETMVSWLPQYHDYGLIGVFCFTVSIPVLN
ncbi:hypothetical protein BCR33DRAFT_194626 [Rhizoclosmatium globosum]|uniref:AMP-dependent synthetase/ligase domain-containing protein n=1 Tax=Rhizoclosmatium globosum TaxID=329046 RepID=A0A1Y2CFV5_9FUNG|nr:hypothetical protein BCR33DRAFT_194626 [Rhizoclosmatium globosum]|eukprot:ORY45175.1 hypothetical protein BCR33DRAFT_194626 [Rhizoclosmatium globosum]